MKEGTLKKNSGTVTNNLRTNFIFENIGFFLAAIFFSSKGQIYVCDTAKPSLDVKKLYLEFTKDMECECYEEGMTVMFAADLIPHAFVGVSLSELKIWGGGYLNESYKLDLLRKLREPFKYPKSQY